ncbi:ferrous iron transport protein A [Chloroflexota bacterium]
MSDKEQVSLSKMDAGQTGTVVDIRGGQNVTSRLNALNIRIGKEITKISSMLMRGPVTIEVGNSRVAIGYGMANRIIVEI